MVILAFVSMSMYAQSIVVTGKVLTVKDMKLLVVVSLLKELPVLEQSPM